MILVMVQHKIIYQNIDINIQYLIITPFSNLTLKQSSKPNEYDTQSGKIKYFQLLCRNTKKNHGKRGT